MNWQEFLSKYSVEITSREEADAILDVLGCREFCILEWLNGSRFLELSDDRKMCGFYMCCYGESEGLACITFQQAMEILKGEKKVKTWADKYAEMRKAKKEMLKKYECGNVSVYFNSEGLKIFLSPQESIDIDFEVAVRLQSALNTAMPENVK